MLSIFSFVCCPSVCLLWRNVYLGFPPIFWLGLFFFLILSCMSCLYILEINPLSVASFANIFSHSDGCLLVLFMVSFAVQKLLSLIRFHLFVFVLIFYYSRSWVKKDVAVIYVKDCWTGTLKEPIQMGNKHKMLNIIIQEENTIEKKMWNN